MTDASTALAHGAWKVLIVATLGSDMRVAGYVTVPILLAPLLGPGTFTRKSQRQDACWRMAPAITAP